MNKNLLSEILDIEETDYEDILYQAFVEQYGDYWLSGDLVKRFNAVPDMGTAFLLVKGIN
ncbi:hypothetical protein [Brevibacillus reuszeri]|uniref:hypothetical protein n=1 Tax=Brevibacillus reuszeri TaxID=54915 RepID=UPI000CCC06A7|nr:hypothetical protein [Brevibacillus reuszeri]